MGWQQWSVKQAPRLLRSRDLHIPFQNNKQTNRHSKKNYIWILPVACFVFRYNKNEAFQTKQTNQQQSKRNGFSFRRKWLGKSVRCAWVARAPIGREHTFHNRIRRYPPVVEHISCFSFSHEFINTQTNKQTDKGGVCFEPDYFFRCRFWVSVNTNQPTNQQTTTETNNKQLTNLRWLPETIKQTNKIVNKQTNKIGS